MKILVTGRAIPQQPDRCTGQQLVQGFREAGHDAFFYGCFYGQPANFLGAKECQEIPKWDLVVATEMNDGMAGYEPLYNYYKLQNVPKVYWDFDISYNEPSAWQRAGAHPYDAYLVGNKLWLDRFKDKFNRPVLHLPYACSPTIHRRKPEIAKQFTLGFVGSMTPERQALLQRVTCIEGVFGEKLIDATNRLYTMVHINQAACKGLVPGRPWETAGCGTNLLMDRASYEDFKEFIPEYLDGYAVIPFDSPDEVEAYIEANRGNEAMLEESGEMLMKFMHFNHSYKNRAEAIVEFCQGEKLL